MSSSRVDPELRPDDVIRLFDHHRPALAGGDYSVELIQDLEARAADGSSEVADSWTHELSFSVAGPRFSLSPGDIHSVFPPDTARGAFSHILPHVVLTRPTLPWERSGDEQTGDDRAPWLALIVLSPSEVALVERSTEPATAATKRRVNRGLPTELADDPSEQLSLLSLPSDLASSALPSRDLLTRLCHVRTVGDRDSDERGTESAVVIANRFPEPNAMNQVHLVSVEGLYNPGEDGPRIGAKRSISLISLKSWDIFCQADPEIDFATLAAGLTTSTSSPLLRRPTEELLDEAARSYTERGFVPVEHRFRNGDSGVSWYHGPLLPGPAPLAAAAQRDGVSVLPARAADDLLLLDADLDMLDCSYSAAWELGRLLTLSRPKIAIELSKWKQAQDHHRHSTDLADDTAALPLQVASPAAPAPGDLAGFFADVALLRGVPFSYLVPEPAMVADESLAFFAVDPTWVDCLLDGAFAVGRSTTAEMAGDEASRGAIVPAPSTLSGVMIRSALVAGFPGLLVDGYAETPDGDDATKPHGLGEPMDIVRREALGPGLLLVLFAGEVRTLDLHLHPQAMHYGVASTVQIPPSRVFVPNSKATGASKVAKEHLSGAPLVRFVRQDL